MNDYCKYSDEKLTALLREDEPIRSRAFDVLFDRYSARLNAYCLFRTNSVMDAEELLQDTWLKFLNAVKAGRHPEKILPYLYSIARNIAIDRYRQKNAKKAIVIDFTDANTLDELVNPAEFLSQMENEDLISMIKIAVNNLDEIYKETFVLFWFGGLSYREIGEVTDVSEAGAKMRCHRATGMIKDMLKPYFEEISDLNGR